jgi:hypothetical protein
MSRLDMLEGAKFISAGAATIALAGGGAYYFYLINRFQPGPEDKWFIFLFLVLLLLVVALTIWSFQAPLYKEEFVKEIVRHHMQTGRPMSLSYNWLGVSLHLMAQPTRIKTQPTNESQMEIPLER